MSQFNAGIIGTLYVPVINCVQVNCKLLLQQLGRCWFVENLDDKAILFYGLFNKVFSNRALNMGPIGGPINEVSVYLC